jgi:hypothetical protein
MFDVTSIEVMVISMRVVHFSLTQLKAAQLRDIARISRAMDGADG